MKTIKRLPNYPSSTQAILLGIGIGLILWLLVGCSIDEDENKQFIPIDNREQLSADIQNLLFKIDSFRIENGMPKFKVDSLHSELALIRNISNAEFGTISHDEFSTVYVILINSGLNAIGENLGYKYSSAKTVFEAWIKSDHIDNILSDAIYTGANRYKDSISGDVYYCQIFSR